MLKMVAVCSKYFQNSRLTRGMSLVVGKTRKIASVSRIAGEDDGDYLMRVERLICDAGFRERETLRKSLS